MDIERHGNKEVTEASSQQNAEKEIRNEASHQGHKDSLRNIDSVDDDTHKPDTPYDPEKRATEAATEDKTQDPHKALAEALTKVDSIKTEDTPKLKVDAVVDMPVDSHKAHINRLSTVDAIPEAIKETPPKRFEDYTYSELMDMARDNPDKVTELNNDFRERYEAESRGMTQEEYRNYKEQFQVCEKGETFQPERKGEHLSVEEMSQIRDIVYPHCDRAREIANNATKIKEGNLVKDDTGVNFTDHNEAHIEQVVVQTTEVLDAAVEAISANKIERDGSSGDIHFSENVDYKVIQAAAFAHDTGMSDDGYAFVFDDHKNPLKDNNGNYAVEKQNPQAFDSVRNNHSANSALNILKSRENYKDIGFTDSQIDEMAVLAHAHSKSSSGIRDLNSSESWKEGFDRLDTLVDAYNKDNPNAKISFDRTRFEGEENKDRLGAVATEALALRVGDVSRDSAPDAPSQSGEPVYVTRKENVDISDAKTYKEETAAFDVKRDTVEINTEKSKQVHIGEQNIVENHTEFKDEKLTHTITVNDANCAPLCTLEAVKDHLGEWASAKNGDYVVDVRFKTICTDTVREKYESWRDEIEKDKDEQTKQLKYENINIVFPWDEKEYSNEN